VTTYGDGSDGALAFDGVSTVLGMAPTSGTYTLTRNINASSMTIAGSVTVFVANWQIFCTGALTGAGSTTSVIHCNGPDSPAAVANAPQTYALGVPAGFYGAGAAGTGQGGYVASGNVTDAIPPPITISGYADSGLSGGGVVTPGDDGPSPMKGGGGGSIWNVDQSNRGIAGGTHTPLTSSSGYTAADQLAGHPADNPTVKYRWGSGGGIGASGATGGSFGFTIQNPVGGGGGAGGACLFVAAHTISGVRLQANGGRGADGNEGHSGTGSGAGGGGGGGGGIAILYCDSQTDVVVEALGGAPGLARTGGVGCVASNGGRGADGYALVYGPATVSSSDLLYWGPLFPDAGGGHFLSTMFPDGVPGATVIQPTGPGGAATFLLLESGSKITYSWATDVQKAYSGKEYRPQALDDPKRTLVGAATLLGDDTRTMRARLARYAAIGSTFLLGLPFEAVSITGDATGKVIPTTSTAVADWAAVGQRVVVSDGNGGAIDATIQALTASSITIDIDPGSLGNLGGMVMPTVPVFFDPQMTFDRFRVNAVERWNLNARAAVFGWPTAGRAAFAALADFAIATPGNLVNLVIKAAAPGAQGNAISIRFIADLTGSIPTRTGSGNTYVFHYNSTTTAAAMVAAIIATGALTVAGSYKPSALLLAGDAIGPFALSNGSDTSYGAMGLGATIATYAGRPVWTKGVQVEMTANDSIQSLAELVDLGGLPISIGTAAQSDWGRALYLNRTSVDDWQWIKAFLAAVRGRQRAFWCASWRADLTLASTAIGGGSFVTGTITVFGPSDAAGGIDAWFPLQRDRLQLRQVDGTITLAQITSVTDNHDGTLAVALAFDSAPSAAALDLVSWLELCRMEADTFEFTWEGAMFTFNAQARVVQQ
jgi:hypothetical protein